MRILFCLFVLTFLLGCQQKSKPAAAKDSKAKKTAHQLQQEQLEEEKASAEKLREQYAVEIKESINSFSEFRPYQFLKVAELKVLSGGKTESGDYLFICEPKVVLLKSVSELKDLYKSVFRKQYQSLGQAELLNTSQKMTWMNVPDFEVGDVVSKTKIRVRVERAGGSMIVTSVEPENFMIGSTQLSNVLSTIGPYLIEPENE